MPSYFDCHSNTLVNIKHFSFSAPTLSVGDKKSIRPVKNGCCFVGGDNLTGALHVL